MKRYSCMMSRNKNKTHFAIKRKKEGNMTQTRIRNRFATKLSFLICIDFNFSLIYLDNVVVVWVPDPPHQVARLCLHLVQQGSVQYWLKWMNILLNKVKTSHRCAANMKIADKEWINRKRNFALTCVKTLLKKLLLLLLVTPNCFPPSSCGLE